MATSTRLQKLESQLAIGEASFEELLLASLQRCELGQWGMFGQNDASYGAAYGAQIPKKLESDDGLALLALVAEIEAMRERLGYTEPNRICALYLQYRKRRGSNDCGEPKLAQMMLAEIANLDRPT